MFFDLFVESGGEGDTWISNLALLLLQIGEMNKKNYEVCFFSDGQISFVPSFVRALTNSRTHSRTHSFVFSFPYLFFRSNSGKQKLTTLRGKDKEWKQPT